MPIFSSTPASTTEPAVGASTCASGSQVWSGNIGTLIANASANAPNSQNWVCHQIARHRDHRVEQRGRVAARRRDEVERVAAGLLLEQAVDHEHRDQHQAASRPS